MLAGFSQSQATTGQETEVVLEAADTSDFPLMLLLIVPFLIGVLTGCLGLWVWWRSRRAKSDPVIFYKAPNGVVLHLDKKCHYLKKTKRLDEWSPATYKPPMLCPGLNSRQAHCLHSLSADL